MFQLPQRTQLKRQRDDDESLVADHYHFEKVRFDHGPGPAKHQLT